MEILKRTNKDEPSILDDFSKKDFSRRRFLRFSGFAGATAVVAGSISLSSCKKDDDVSSNGVNLGSGDTGILNYAYALEQLEAAFYSQVVANGSFTTAFSALEQEYIKDVRDHEIAHREFFKAALGSSAIQSLEVDFSKIDFSNRMSVLNTAKTFEDLGVAAYNGAGKLLTSPDYLTLAGKIVSVEARHAALFRDLISNGSFADLSALQPMGADNGKGLDVAMNPPDVLTAASAYIKTTINASNLPTT
ncbi:MAG TPA: ferritin-like domain-containing protein [Flavisolibacter sp.]|nr:ferritin-like domain-containing protein [Flavisolibacter sp.]